MHFLVDPFSCVHMILALIGLSCLLTPEEVLNQEKGQISWNPRFEFGRPFHSHPLRPKKVGVPSLEMEAQRARAGRTLCMLVTILTPRHEEHEPRKNPH